MACDANASQVLVSQVKVDSQSRTQLYHTGLGRSEFVGKQNSIMESNVRTVNIHEPIHIEYLARRGRAEIKVDG